MYCLLNDKKALKNLIFGLGAQKNLSAIEFKYRLVFFIEMFILLLNKLLFVFKT